MGEISEGCKKIIAILKAAETDTEKFAALFMVTKLVKGKDCKTAARKAIFEAIGFKFLKRLLLTPDVPVDCPPVVYKSVALSILTCFCNDPELATHPEMLANIPVFLDIVAQADNTDYDDNLIIVGEAYVCLQNIAAHDPGQRALLEVGTIKKMSEIYAQQSFQTDEALNIIVKLVTRFGPSAWETNPKSFHALVNKIALDFETDHSERKFELSSILNALLFNCRRKIISNTASDETWPISIFKGLNDILGSRIGKNQRNPAIILASTVVDLLGVEWTLQDEEKPKVFFLLLIQLSAIEIRMLESNSLKQAFVQAELITACFVIIEAMVSYIASDQIDLEQKEKQSVYTGLKGAFTAIINILTKVSLDKNKDNLPVEEKVFVYAMARVLAAWLAQETSALRAQVYKLLPFILTLTNETFYTQRNKRLAEKSAAGGQQNVPTERNPHDGIDILRVFLPALCHLAVEDEARKIILDTKQDEVLYECMDYHWSIVHWKKPPVPKSERGKIKTQPEPGPDADTLEEMKDSRAAMVSICNIFMNITVLEPKIVENSLLFNTLLKFIFNNLPELKNSPENLVLHGHLAILGLLLLKQKSKQVRQNDFSICRYIQATITFLWDAFIVDESNDPTALVVAMSYKEHWMELMELWFLGMQTMSGVLAQIPWISEFAIESGWAEGIIETLKKVKVGSLQPNVKSAYEDFLSQLVDANKNVVTVLKKCDALKLSECLRNENGIPQQVAANICSSYLRKFRQCPDNPEYSLERWRLKLWQEILGDKYALSADDIYRQWLRLRYHYLTLDADTKLMLTKLRQNYQLALITNGPSNAQWEKVQRLHLRQYFDLILVSGDLPWEKPNAGIFHRACTYLGVEPSRCLMVGDKLETDILGGVQAQLGGTVWIPLTPTSLHHKDPSPDFTIATVTDLVALLPSHPKPMPFTRHHSNGLAQLQFRIGTTSGPDLDECNSNSSDGF